MRINIHAEDFTGERSTIEHRDTDSGHYIGLRLHMRGGDQHSLTLWTRSEPDPRAAVGPKGLARILRRAADEIETA